MAEDGVMLVKDIKTAQSFDDNLKNPVLAMQYGFSLVSCLASGLSEPGGLGLGTLGLNPALMAELASAAGFGSTVTHDLDDPTHLYYEIRP